jgi:tRNA-specific 2-thiouridylase
LDFALQTGASSLATGHYCRLSNEHRLLRGSDASKDQTYFLAGLTPSQLEHVEFPVGSLLKKEVRRIAAEQHFSNALKKDSTGICFIGERNFREFLKQYLPAQKGEIVDERGKHIGFHEGLMYYTLGQRRGLGIGGKKDGTGESWFVIGKDLNRNLLIVQQGEHEELFSTDLISEKTNWITGSCPNDHFRCTAKFRYRQPDQPVTVHMNADGSAKVLFDQPQRAVTPGQWVVFYNGDECLGGAPILSTTPLKKICI